MPHVVGVGLSHGRPDRVGIGGVIGEIHQPEAVGLCLDVPEVLGGLRAEQPLGLGRIPYRVDPETLGLGLLYVCLVGHHHHEVCHVVSPWVCTEICWAAASAMRPARYGSSAVARTWPMRSSFTRRGLTREPGSTDTTASQTPGTAAAISTPVTLSTTPAGAVTYRIAAPRTGFASMALTDSPRYWRISSSMVDSPKLRSISSVIWSPAGRGLISISLGPAAVYLSSTCAMPRSKPTAAVAATAACCSSSRIGAGSAVGKLCPSSMNRLPPPTSLSVTPSTRTNPDSARISTLT